MRLRFQPGMLVATPGALRSLHQEEVVAALRRHLTGDWGELDEHDRRVNEHALLHGGRLFSAYGDRHAKRFWIITEADRSATTILLPDEY